MKKLGTLILGAILTIGIGAGISFKQNTDVAKAATTEIVFNLGSNGTATHKDGSTAESTYSETVGAYTLSITDGSKMYPGSFDAKGNSCLKFGTSSVVGSCKFTVPEDVVTVIIEAGKYKSKTSKINVNDATYTLTGASDNGAYDEITVDTSSTKTVTLTTVSGGVRAMINTITYCATSSADENLETIEITGGLTKTEYLSTDTEWNVSGLETSVEDVTWSFAPESPLKMGVGENKTLTITAKKDGYNSGVIEQTVSVARANVSIAEALEIPDDSQISVRGIVSEINTPYSSSYNNISLTITDGENDLYIFRLTGEYEVGDDITVTGTMATYQGKRQIAQGATAVLHSSGNEIPGYVAPVEVSISEALEASDDTWVIVTGMVSNIGTAWDDTNGRISVTITDGNDELYVYRLYTKVALYDYITITGKMGTYKGNRQLAEGSTAVVTNNATTVAARIKILAGGWDNGVTTENCYNNYAVANELVLALSAEELETFKKSSIETEIGKAKKTYEHWCFVNSATPYQETVLAGSRLSAFNNSNNVIIIVVAISSLVILATAGLLISRKRRYSK